MSKAANPEEQLSSTQKAVNLTEIVDRLDRIEALLSGSKFLREDLDNCLQQWLGAHSHMAAMFKPPDAASLDQDVDMTDATLTSQVSPFSTSSETSPPVPPKTASAFVDYMSKRLPHIRALLLRCTVDSNGNFTKLPLVNREKVELSNYCKTLVNAPKLSATQHKKLNLKNTLRFIMGHLPKSMVNVPREAVEAAEIAFKRFEAERWGEPISEAGLSFASTSVLRGNHQFRRKLQTSITSQKNGPKSSQVDQGQEEYSLVRPSPRHPIYGTNGIMRGILIERGKRTSFKFDPEASRANFRTFGQNGLQVGQWWPRKICALRDGAHGSLLGGISGSVDEGVWSVVINCGYSETDHDMGGIVWYSMPNSTVNDKPTDCGAADAVKKMRLSWTQNKPIRVIRGKGAGWDGAPCTGFRYDGLYGITDEQVSTNRKGGLYVRFKLERLSDQADIDTVRSRPTPGEITDEARVIEGYY